MKSALIIGYGNPLREDDGVGPRAAELVAAALPGGEVEVLTATQLTPELAALITERPLVVFLDAEVSDAPGEVWTRAVRTEQPQEAWTHQASPAQLLGMTKELYGAIPQAYLITGAVAHVGWREGLSGTAESVARQMANAAVEILRG